MYAWIQHYDTINPPLKKKRISWSWTVRAGNRATYNVSSNWISTWIRLHDDYSIDFSKNDWRPKIGVIKTRPRDTLGVCALNAGRPRRGCAKLGPRPPKGGKLQWTSPTNTPNVNFTVQFFFRSCKKKKSVARQARPWVAVVRGHCPLAIWNDIILYGFERAPLSQKQHFHMRG